MHTLLFCLTGPLLQNESWFRYSMLCNMRVPKVKPWESLWQNCISAMAFLLPYQQHQGTERWYCIWLGSACRQSSWCYRGSVALNDYISCFALRRHGVIPFLIALEIVKFDVIVVLYAAGWLQLPHTCWQRKSGTLEPACLLHVLSPSVSSFLSLLCVNSYLRFNPLSVFECALLFVYYTSYLRVGCVLAKCY